MESSLALCGEAPPLGRLVFRGNVGVAEGGGWGAFALRDERNGVRS